jgi:hypothetical protein
MYVLFSKFILRNLPILPLYEYLVKSANYETICSVIVPTIPLGLSLKARNVFIILYTIQIIKKIQLTIGA